MGRRVTGSASEAASSTPISIRSRRRQSGAAWRPIRIGRWRVGRGGLLTVLRGVAHRRSHSVVGDALPRHARDVAPTTPSPSASPRGRAGEVGERCAKTLNATGRCRVRAWRCASPSSDRPPSDATRSIRLAGVGPRGRRRVRAARRARGPTRWPPRPARREACRSFATARFRRKGVAIPGARRGAPRPSAPTSTCSPSSRRSSPRRSSTAPPRGSLCFHPSLLPRVPGRQRAGVADPAGREGGGRHRVPPRRRASTPVPSSSRRALCRSGRRPTPRPVSTSTSSIHSDSTRSTRRSAAVAAGWERGLPWRKTSRAGQPSGPGGRTADGASSTGREDAEERRPLDPRLRSPARAPGRCAAPSVVRLFGGRLEAR